MLIAKHNPIVSDSIWDHCTPELLHSVDMHTLNLLQHPSCAYVESIGGGVQPWFTYKHPPNTPGNVNSVSALAGFNGRMYFGEPLGYNSPAR